LKVEQIEATCHLGHRSCLFKKKDKDGNLRILGKKISEPGKVYNEEKPEIET